MGNLSFIKLRRSFLFISLNISAAVWILFKTPLVFACGERVQYDSNNRNSNPIPSTIYDLQEVRQVSTGPLRRFEPVLINGQVGYIDKELILEDWKKKIYYYVVNSKGKFKESDSWHRDNGAETIEVRFTFDPSEWRPVWGIQTVNGLIHRGTQVDGYINGFPSRGQVMFVWPNGQAFVRWGHVWGDVKSETEGKGWIPAPHYIYSLLDLSVLNVKHGPQLEGIDNLGSAPI